MTFCWALFSHNMRLFIAIVLEDRIKDAITPLQDTLIKLQSGVKLVEEENIHLTMRFLGEIEDSRLDELKQAIAVVEDFPCFELHLKGIGSFPNERNPKVIWVGCQPNRTLLDIYQAMENSLKGMGLPPDDHVFSAHITIGRNKFPQFSNSFQSFMAKNAGTEIGKQAIKEITLFQSTLTPKGPIYTNIRDFKLKE